MHVTMHVTGIQRLWEECFPSMLDPCIVRLSHSFHSPHGLVKLCGFCLLYFHQKVNPKGYTLSASFTPITFAPDSDWRMVGTPSIFGGWGQCILLDSIPSSLSPLLLAKFKCERQGGLRLIALSTINRVLQPKIATTLSKLHNLRKRQLTHLQCEPTKLLLSCETSGYLIPLLMLNCLISSFLPGNTQSSLKILLSIICSLKIFFFKSLACSFHSLIFILKLNGWTHPSLPLNCPHPPSPPSVTAV